MRYLSLECCFEVWFVDFRMQINAKANEKENGLYALNAAFISWMPLRSVIFRFQNANTKWKCKCKGKCIGKWFLCPKCGIYLLNAALKHDLSISEDKYRGLMQKQRQMHRKCFLCHKCGIYLLNAALKCDLSISEGKYKGECKGKGKGKGKVECKGIG